MKKEGLMVEIFLNGTYARVLRGESHETSHLVNFEMRQRGQKRYGIHQKQKLVDRFSKETFSP